MKVCYINTDAAADRRAYVEKNFTQNNTRNWRLERVPAITPERLATFQFPFAKMRDVEACCFLSHVEALRNNVDHADDLMIVEDDVSFGPNTQAVISATVSRLPRNAWDILFCDLCFPDVRTMLTLYEIKRQLKGGVQVQDLHPYTLSYPTISFAGATAYIVNRDRIGVLANHLMTDRDITLPYDIWLWRLIHDKSISAQLIFPFPTTLSHFADASQIQSDDTSVTTTLWNNFRRLMWFDGGAADAEMSLARIEETFFNDPSARIMARIVQGVIGENFRDKAIHP